MTRNIEEITATVQQSSQFIPNMIREMECIIVGQRYLIDRLILGLLTGEHILVEASRSPCNPISLRISSSIPSVVSQSSQSRA